MSADPTRADMNPAEFDNIAGTERTHWWYRGQREILRRFLAPYVRERVHGLVLEAGCGTGYNAQVMAEEYGWRMVPLDLGREGLDYARRNSVPRLCQGDVAKLPFATAAFDAVVSLDVIVHFPLGREGEAFTELARVVKPGGLFVVRVSALDILRSRHSMHAAERQRFTRGRLIQAAEEAGFAVLRTSYANSLLMPVALLKFRVWEPLFDSEPESGVLPVSPWLDKTLHAALALESRCIGLNMNLPIGQSLVLVGRRRDR